MQRIQTCTLPDDFRHVCFKDLEQYINVDNFIDILKGFSSEELNQIRAVLGIPNQYHIDSKVNGLSRNPVENQAVCKALSKKADTDQLAYVAHSGSYNDLSNKPCALRNPNELLIFDVNGKAIHYDGSEPMGVKTATALIDLSDYKDKKNELEDTIAELRSQISDLKEEVDRLKGASQTGSTEPQTQG